MWRGLRIFCRLHFFASILPGRVGHLRGNPKKLFFPTWHSCAANGLYAIPRRQLRFTTANSPTTRRGSQRSISIHSPPGRQRSQDGNHQVVLRLGHAVGGRERWSTAAVQTLARLPGDFPITRSVWTAVALAPLWCLTETLFEKNCVAGQKVVDKKRKWVFNGLASLKRRGSSSSLTPLV